MIDVPAIIAALTGKTGPDAAQYLAWNVMGVSILALTIIPFIVFLVASYSTGSITKKNWPKIVVPFLIADTIVLISIFTGILPTYTMLR